jgi:hypothetical protein
MVHRPALRWLCWLACLACPAIAAAQAIQFGQTTPLALPPSAGAYVAPSAATPGAFNPYAGSPGIGASPGLGTPNFGTPSTGLGATSPYTYTPPAATTPGSFFPNSGTPANSMGPYSTPPIGGYPNSVYPSQQPAVLFPNGFYGSGSAVDPIVEPLRIFQSPRFSETWLYGGDDPRDVQIHDMEAAVTGVLPNFLGSTQPLRVSPTFRLHLWDGPSFMPADLPPSAYSAFVDFQWATDPARIVGAEFDLRLGVFTDFNTFNSDSFRVIGDAYGVVRLTDNLTFKLGVWYLNRNDIKLLPSGGLVWQPNPQLRYDILFPNPRVTQYWTTIGNHDLWWYVSGEYGGDAWTIERTDGSSDRIDINDLRVKFGVDFLNQRGWNGYFEVGYVFNREVVYVVDPSDSFEPPDTFLMGAGIRF